MAPNVTEILFAIGAGDKVVGVTRYCDFPTAAKSLPRVGGLVDPDAEAIAGLEPDLVIGVTSSGDSQLPRTLARLELDYAFVRMENLDETFEGIATIGALVGHDKAATQLAQSMQNDVRKFESRERVEKPPTVLMVFGRQPLVAAGPGTFADDLLIRAGGRNVLGPSAEAYPRLDIEKVVELNPDRIIDLTMATSDDPGVAFWQQFQGLHAVESRNVYRYDDPALLRPGPRLIDGFRTIAMAIKGKHSNH